MSGDLQDESKYLGSEASPSFVREAEGTSALSEPVLGAGGQNNRGTARRARRIR
jgi:hypothetical protein